MRAAASRIRATGASEIPPLLGLIRLANDPEALDREPLQALRLATQELGANAVGDNVGRQRGMVEGWL